MKYGVVVHQGALTVYNYSSDPESIINANIKNITLGREKAPVIGSGVFVGGFNEKGGKVNLEYLSTNKIYTNGYIPFGQPNIITGAIFILNGTHAKTIETKEQITTYGVNDMALDVWGEVDNWEVTAPVITYGTSAIGFVNFGTVHKFVMNKKILTKGSGARGFNQYDGTIDDATFDSIITEGDGSIGMQFSMPVDKIKVKEIITNGSEGESLVSGVITTLKAIGLSIKDGGEINELTVEKNIETHGEEITTFVVEDGGKLNKFTIGGSVKNLGSGEQYEIDSELPEDVVEEIRK
ncbi:hypothetical protein [Helcococcus kunzii]|uniref:hypothetical protein n=1 Tax=Helcococcus kunzii TaxID=40091 RepID=UPI0021A74E49|nr:hypothetical protein [Helcococcus kunzii]MCT1796766.1 hypothetical protein [Helcococcus kunzii]MCT1988846.1 hypothetical protein [Helcococcus kunzii]